MDKKIIILILIVIIVGAGALLFAQFGGKINTEIKFISKDTLQNGEQLQLELKDAQGNPIAGQNVNITFDGKKNSVVTDSSGKAYLTIHGEDAGKYDVTVDYGGDGKYNGCTGKVTITITDDDADNPVTQTETNSTASTSNYDANESKPQDQGRVTYDRVHAISYNENGVVLSSPDGRGVGMTVDEYLNWRPDPFM